LYAWASGSGWAICPGFWRVGLNLLILKERMHGYGTSYMYDDLSIFKVTIGPNIETISNFYFVFAASLISVPTI